MICQALKYKLLTAPVVLSFLIAPLFLRAQSNGDFKPLTADNVKITSKVLNEDRKLYIYVPPADSTNPGKRYPVLYLMDGESHFSMIAELCRYLSRWDVNVMPEMIVVGIPNTNRTRDLTPTHSIIDYYGKPDTSSTSWLKPSGGNDKFLQFIGEELMPYVDLHYKTQPFKIFAGHSFGGITAIDCLLNNPDMFNAFVAVSPSFWWDREHLLKLADQKLQKGLTLNKIFFYSDASEGIADKSTFHVNLLKFDSLIVKKQLTGLNHKYVYYPNDIHMTEPVKAYYDALRFIYQDWSLPPLEPKMVSSAVIMKHYQQLSLRYGYTILPNEVNINDWALYLMKNDETLNNAISLFEMNALNFPSSYKAFNSLGDAYAKKGQKQKAVNSYKKAIELNPTATVIKSKLKTL
jgi:predicted alpha/beta superfamily hydrolase